MFKLILFLTFGLGVLSSEQSLLNRIKQKDNRVFNDYFNSVQWITRDGVLSLSIDHKNVQLSKVDDSFSEIEARFSSDPNWRNRDSLYAQYYCHVIFAQLKNPWNIEPHRTETSWIQMLLTGCNPRLYEKYFGRKLN